MRYTAFFVPLLAILAPAPARAADPPKLDLKDGDRIVYLGNTFAERDASYGYLETLLTARFPDTTFTFRNLGWSGDTVWGDARARFGTRVDGFNHLKEHVLALKPTVVLVAYGMNESFAGEAGLKEFEAGLNTLLDTLAETKAKIVLISPIPHENLGPPLPDPAKHNRDLARYAEVLRATAARRDGLYVDLLTPIDPEVGTAGQRLTVDGLHPTNFGYWIVANLIAEALGTSPSSWQVEIGAGPKVEKATGARAAGLVAAPSGLQFRFTPERLPNIPPDRDPGMGKALEIYTPFFREDVLVVGGLAAGQYRVQADGKTVAIGSERSLAKRQEIHDVLGQRQVEALRAAINKKNELYFNRWRPQNETYLFGFRKHEQGNNSVEIPQFDPLVAEMEAEIARLKKPVPHTYELIREEAGK